MPLLPEVSWEILSTMNHCYFASLLENYRRRMDMDASVLSIRKTLYNSYKNESFKLKEQQRHAMAKQRREEMETNRVFKNKLKEIKEKEKEISKRYAQHRMPPVRKNEMSDLRAAKVKENLTQQKVSVFLPAINASGFGDKDATELYQSEHELSRNRTFNKRRLLRGQDSNRHYDKSEMNLTPALNRSNLTENLINYYKSSQGLRGIKSNSQVQGKKSSIGTVTFEEQRRHVGREEALNTSSPCYDILVIEHGNDDSTSRQDDI